MAQTLIIFVVAVVAGYPAYRRAGGENIDYDTIFRGSWPISRGSWPKTVGVAVGLSVFVVGSLIVQAWPK